MTYQQFLSQLQHTPRDWRVTEFGHIRRGEIGAEQCPITSLLNEEVDRYYRIAEKLRLARETRRKIMSAADGFRRYMSGKRVVSLSGIRGDLLRACGLTESYRRWRAREPG